MVKNKFLGLRNFTFSLKYAREILGNSKGALCELLHIDFSKSCHLEKNFPGGWRGWCSKWLFSLCKPCWERGRDLRPGFACPRSQEEQKLFSFTFWKVEEGKKCLTWDVFKMSQNSSVLFHGFGASQLLAQKLESRASPVVHLKLILGRAA